MIITFGICYLGFAWDLEFGVWGLRTGKNTELRSPSTDHKQKIRSWRLPTLPSHKDSVPSASEGLTAVFGMGTGVTPPVLISGPIWKLNKVIRNS